MDFNDESDFDQCLQLFCNCSFLAKGAGLVVTCLSLIGHQRSGSEKNLQKIAVAPKKTSSRLIDSILWSDMLYRYCCIVYIMFPINGKTSPKPSRSQEHRISCQQRGSWQHSTRRGRQDISWNRHLQTRPLNSLIKNPDPTCTHAVGGRDLNERREENSARQVLIGAEMQSPSSKIEEFKRFKKSQYRLCWVWIL